MPRARLEILRIRDGTCGFVGRKTTVHERIEKEKRVV